MNNNQNQAAQKNDQITKPIVLDEAAKKAEAAKAANDSAKPVDAAKVDAA